MIEQTAAACCYLPCVLLGIRTRNLLFRKQTRYPLRQQDVRKIWEPAFARRPTLSTVGPDIAKFTGPVVSLPRTVPRPCATDWIRTSMYPLGFQLVRSERPYCGIARCTRRASARSTPQLRSQMPSRTCDRRLLLCCTFRRHDSNVQVPKERGLQPPGPPLPNTGLIFTAVPVRGVEPPPPKRPGPKPGAAAISPHGLALLLLLQYHVPSGMSTGFRSRRPAANATLAESNALKDLGLVRVIEAGLLAATAEHLGYERCKLVLTYSTEDVPRQFSNSSDEVHGYTLVPSAGAVNGSRKPSGAAW